MNERQPFGAIERGGSTHLGRITDEEADAAPERKLKDASKLACEHGFLAKRTWAIATKMTGVFAEELLTFSEKRSMLGGFTVMTVGS